MTRYLIWTFLVIVLAGVIWNYNHLIVKRDFVVINTTSCDPTTSMCFVWCEDDVCEDDYYSKISKIASNIHMCNEATEDCEPLSCEIGEIGCEIITCSEDTSEEGEMCTNPLDFQTEELIEETFENTSSSTEFDI